jgi:DNA repair exonuclease SbcCD nuclease subunit
VTTTREDLRHDAVVDIEVQIGSKQPLSKQKRAFKLETVDTSSNPIPVIIWEKHRHLSSELKPGKTVHLSNFKVKSWSGKPVELHSIGRSEVEKADFSPTKLLHVSDTHFGYHLRPGSGGKTMPWDREVDCKSRFTSAVIEAIAHEAKALIHTGDIFDHATTEKDLDFVEKQLSILAENGCPMYYVLGNHETASGRELLRELHNEEVAFPLEGRLGGYSVGDVTLYGLNNRSSDWLRSPNFRFQPAETQYSVLSLHQTISPPYSKSGFDATLDTILNGVATRLDLDLVLAGDLHLPLSETNSNVPIHYTGPVGRISSNYRNEQPQAKLFEFTGDLSPTTVYL